MFKRIEQNQKNQNVQIKIISEALLRLKIDLDEIKNNEELKKLGDFEFPKDDEYEFNVTLRPKQNSLWYRGIYTFRFIIPLEFPHTKGPSVKCLKRILHPNIDFDGNVCLNLLREDYSPTDPNPTNPLNVEIAQIMKENYQQFQNLVQSSLKGYSYKNYQFEKFI